MKRFTFFAGLAAMLLAETSGCASSAGNIPAVSGFEPGKYMGVWYEIARLPHRFERGLDYVQAEYTLNPDGTIRVVNQGIRNGEKRRIVGKAKLKYPHAKPLTGELRVSFFGPFYSDYRIIELADDYNYAAVTGSSMDYLWILARKPDMAPERLREILGRMEKLGFAVGKLEYPQQNPAGNGESAAK